MEGVGVLQEVDEQARALGSAVTMCSCQHVLCVQVSPALYLNIEGAIVPSSVSTVLSSVASVKRHCAHAC